jgi:hypothetical protein
MSETAVERAAVVSQVLEQTSGESSSVREAALKAVIPPPQQSDIGWLWKVLVTGLLVLIGIALIGVLWTVLDGDNKTDADKALIVFTPLLSGLLGLFITSPTAGTTS